MSRYREIYEELKSDTAYNGKPMNTRDLLNDAGIDALGIDDRLVSLEAVIIYLAEQIKELKANPKRS